MKNKRIYCLALMAASVSAIGMNITKAQEVAASVDPLVFYKLANRYASFTKEIVLASNNINDAKNIDAYLDNSTKNLKPEMVDGAKTYAVLAALKSDDFKAGLDDAATKLGPENLVKLLIETPEKVKEIEGYDKAKQLAAVALGDLDSQASQSVAKIHQASYDMQKFAWAKNIIEKQVHLDALDKNYSINSDIPAIDAETIVINGNIEGRKALEINDNLIAAAALFQLDNYDGAYKLIKPNSGNFCIKRAYLNIRQCVAATKFPYEHAFCLSKHSYSEALNCASVAVK